MFDFGKICRTYEKMTVDERRVTLAEDSAAIMPALKALDGDGINAFILFVSTACASSSELTTEEYALFTDVTGISLEYSAACSLIEAANSAESRNAVDAIVDFFGLLSDEIKTSMISFCLCFCSANGKIDSKEKKFIKKLIK